MPLCFLHTNLKESALEDGIELRIARTIGQILGKPLEKMNIIIVPGVRLLRFGTTEPACILNIHSIAVFDADRNPTYTPALKTMLKDELNLPEERCSIVYHDLDSNFLG
uniref:D-dopachrome decarboxylase n=1 Tax=Arion vulgaris TaxID=1028688 RepID=A0A0B6ZX45_9EUPU